MNSRYRSHLDDYTAYHRNPKNKLTHYLGIPMIVFAAIALLRALGLGSLGDVSLDAAMLVMVPILLFYLSLNWITGVAMALVFAGFYFLAAFVAPWPALALFLIGWALQFIGHYYEGKKPAFLKNAVHLLIGPMWILNDLLGKLHLPAYKPKAA